MKALAERDGITGAGAMSLTRIGESEGAAILILAILSWTGRP